MDPDALFYVINTVTIVPVLLEPAATTAQRYRHLAFWPACCLLSAASAASPAYRRLHLTSVADARSAPQSSAEPLFCLHPPRPPPATYLLPATPPSAAFHARCTFSGAFCAHFTLLRHLSHAAAFRYSCAYRAYNKRCVVCSTACVRHIARH